MASDLLQRIETYYDLAPRATAHTEQIGPFTLFVADTGWPFYARPTLGTTSAPTVADVETVLDRQRELRIPLAFEWLHDIIPDLLPIAEAAGLHVHQCPMMILDHDPAMDTETAPEGVDVRLLTPAEPDLVAATRSSVNMAFSTGGVEVADDPPTEAAGVDTVLDRMRDGHIVQVAAIDASTGTVLGGGAHVPRPAAGITELVGIGVRPSARHRGIGLAIARLLATDARASGIATVFLSADSDDVARIYAKAGFVRRGTSCIAEPST